MEFSTLNGYKVKDKKAIRYYDTVADMKNDSTLKNGMYTKTKGYYEINDSGHGEYFITNNQSSTLYQEPLENGLYATLILNDKDIFKVEQFGIKSSSHIINSELATSNTSKLTSLINFLETNNLNGIIKFSNGIYQFLNNIVINKNLRFRGEMDSTDVDLTASNYQGTTLFDVSNVEETEPFITIQPEDWTSEEPSNTRIWGTIFENIKIFGNYQQHDGVIIRNSGHVTRISNTSIMRFLGYGLYLDTNNDSYISNLNIMECGYKSSPTLKYALKLSSDSGLTYKTTNAIHINGLHLEHCRFGIDFEQCDQINVNSFKVELGTPYTSSYSNEDTEPLIKISKLAYRINLDNGYITTKDNVFYGMYIESIATTTRHNRSRNLNNINFISPFETGARFINCEDSNTNISNCNFNISALDNNAIIFNKTNISNCYFGINKTNATSDFNILNGDSNNITNCQFNAEGSSSYVVSAFGCSNSNISNSWALKGISKFCSKSTNYIIPRTIYGVSDSNINTIFIKQQDNSYVIDFNKFTNPYSGFLFNGLSNNIVISDIVNFPTNYELNISSTDTHTITFNQTNNFKIPSGTSHVLSRYGTLTVKKYSTFEVLTSSYNV